MSKTLGPKSNITVEAADIFKALVSGEFDSFAIFSCFFDGEPTSVIVNVTPEKDGEYHIQPLFVFLTESMLSKIKDHEGRIPEVAEGG